MGRTMDKDMTSGSPARLLLKFSIPMLIGNLFQQMYIIVDSIVVGKFVSSDALAAVGATGSLMFLIIGLAFGLSAGISIVISQYYGAKDYDNVRKTFATATYTVIGAAIIMGTLGFFLCHALLKLMNTPESIIDQSTIFMKITFAGILGVTCYNGIAAVLRALGDSITPLIFLALASLLNISLDLLFVTVFHWNVPGVACATVTAQLVSAICCIIYALKRVKILQMPLKDFRPDKEIFKKCLKLGIPVAVQNALISISMIAMQSVLNGYDNVAIAANTAYQRIEQLVLQPGMSIGAALTAFTGQNIGAGRLDRAKKGFYSASCIITVFSLIMLPTIYFGGEAIMKMFIKSSDFEVMRMGVRALRITCFFYLPVGMIFTARNFLSGTGDINVPMIMSFNEVLCRVAFALTLPLFIGVYGIWWATSLNWTITAIIGILRVASGKWKTKSVVRINSVEA
jgi:putative MATE family efflux protein